MLLRKIAILIVLAFGFKVFSNLFEGNFFLFFAWLFVSLALFISFFPFIRGMDEKTAPVFHIFSSLLLFIFFFSSMAILDFQKAGFPLVQSMLFGLAIGVSLLAFIMLVKGSK